MEAALMTRRRMKMLLGALCVSAVAALPPAAWAASGAYVANSTSNTVTQFDIAAGGALALKTPATVATGTGPFGIALSPDGRSAYVNNYTANTVSQYDVGAGGLLTPKTPATVATGTNPWSIAVSPDGRSVYVANSASNTVSQYDVGAGGVLTPKAPATVAAGTTPYGIAVAADGRSVYAGNFGGANVSQYDVGAGGLLTPKTPATVAAGTNPFMVAVAPDGHSVYVANYATSNVSQYDVGGGGLLTPKTPATVATGANPVGIGIGPDGRSAYVTNSGAATLSQYDVGASGLLTPKTPTAVPAGVSPAPVVVSPDGHSVYLANFGSNTVSQYDVGAGGLLTAKTPATVATGVNPRGIALLPDQGPVAVFAAGVAPAGSPTGFDGSASSDPDGSVARYDWNFGDGTVAANAGPTPTHSYTAGGTYTVTLTVADNVGCSTSVVFTGQTALCNGGQAARTTRTLTVPAGPVAPASFGAKTLVSLTLTVKTIPSKGPVAIRISNRNGFRVTGTLAGRTTSKVTVGKRKSRISLKAKSFSVAANSRKTVKLSLPKSLRTVLKRKHKLSLALTARVKDPAGHTRTVRKTVSLRLKTARKR
jgi:YVTN family beta-propeller protein